MTGGQHAAGPGPGHHPPRTLRRWHARADSVNIVDVDDDTPWRYDRLVHTLATRTLELLAHVVDYLDRPELDTAPHERACLEVTLYAIEDALDAIEGSVLGQHLGHTTRPNTVTRGHSRSPRNGA